MRLAAAIFVPGLGAFFDQFDPCISFRFQHRALGRNIILSQEPIMIDLDRVDLASAAEIVRIDVFISHDTTGDGSQPLFFIELSSALRTSDHFNFSLPAATSVLFKPEPDLRIIRHLPRMHPSLIKRDLAKTSDENFFDSHSPNPVSTFFKNRFDLRYQLLSE